MIGRTQAGVTGLIGLAAALLALPTVTVSSPRQPDIAATYRIERGNKPIGSYQVNLYDTPAGEEAATRLSLATRVGPFRVTMLHKSAETWTNAGRLRQLVSATERTGDKSAVTAIAKPDGTLEIDANGQRSAASADVLTNSFTRTGSHFNGHVSKTELLDVLSGAVRPSTIRPLGTEVLSCEGAPCETRVYSIINDATGKPSHQIWLDANGLAVKLVANTRFGITLTYVRERLSGQPS